MTHTFTEVGLLDQYAQLLTFYRDFLDSPDGLFAPSTSSIEYNMSQILALAEGQPLTASRVAALVTAVRHYESGIPAQELGYPGASQQEREEASLTLRMAGDFLEMYAAPHGPVVNQVVEGLKVGRVPRGSQEVASLLALFMHGIPFQAAPAPAGAPALDA